MPLPINDIPAVVTGLCYTCKRPTSQCAECAVVIEINPATGLPVDMAFVDGQYVKVAVDPDFRTYAVQLMICDDCVIKFRQLGAENLGDTGSERHDRGLCANAVGARGAGRS